jgi:hypothetical protein
MTFVAVAASATSASTAGLDAAALMAKLVRPAPATIRFIEVRFSSLLTTPLVVAGQLSYLASDHLERRVERPFRELTTIRGEDVTVAREGEPPVRFSLKRAPQLRGMLSSFGALLAGDRTSLERNFTSSAEGNDARWQLLLTPTDARVHAQLAHIRVDGSDDAPRCFTLLEPDGNANIIVLGDAVPRDLPNPVERGWLEAWCLGVER